MRSDDRFPQANESKAAGTAAATAVAAVREIVDFQLIINTAHARNGPGDPQDTSKIVSVTDDPRELNDLAPDAHLNVIGVEVGCCGEGTLHA
jgi:hypothetical protein